MFCLFKKTKKSREESNSPSNNWDNINPSTPDRRNESPKSYTSSILTFQSSEQESPSSKKSPETQANQQQQRMPIRDNGII